MEGLTKILQTTLGGYSLSRILSALLTLLATGLASFPAAQKLLLDPIRALRVGAGRIAQGDLNSRIPDPFLDKRVCFYPSRLDIAQMRAAAKAFEGTHDFAAVRSVGTETKTTVRTVYWCDAEREGDLITVRVCANGFLYNMVRAMVGTMVYASYGKLRAEDIPALLEMRDRRLTGPTMPPQGLYMHRIWYDGPAGEMMADA